MKNIAFQEEFRPALPKVIASKDYHDFRELLEQMDRILIQSECEYRFVKEQLCQVTNGKQYAKLHKKYRQALRYNILLGLTGYSYRELAVRVADSQLFGWFTLAERIDGVRAVSKSQIERYEKMFDAHSVSELIHDLNRAVSDEQMAQELFVREFALKLDRIFADTSCVKANIHFPVDWVLLRDACRTLITAIVLIRKHGLKHRISEPALFLREMNKLVIEMTHTRKKKNGKTIRKMILRRMKKLTKVIERHGENYYNLLSERWEETDWSEKESALVLERIHNVLKQVPRAIKQAHARLIGETRVSNEDKVLSLYEHDVNVVVRGKAGSEVEFGNALYLAESSDGLIVDWQYIRDSPPHDSKLVIHSLRRLLKNYGSIKSYTTDRGFCSSLNSKTLEELDVYDAICPKAVSELREKLESDEFLFLQNRRVSTEARISILKNGFLGNPFNRKGFSSRRICLNWRVFTHNLWKVARIAHEQLKELRQEQQTA